MTATLAPKSAPGIHDPLDAIKLARAMSWSQWQIYAVKKANATLAAEGLESLIFTGRYSTVAQIRKWLREHPTFVASQVHRKKKEPDGTPPDQRPAASGRPCGSFGLRGARRPSPAGSAPRPAPCA
jgi:hypothetical protein